MKFENQAHCDTRLYRRPVNTALTFTKSGMQFSCLMIARLPWSLASRCSAPTLTSTTSSMYTPSWKEEREDKHRRRRMDESTSWQHCILCQNSLTRDQVIQPSIQNQTTVSTYNVSRRSSHDASLVGILIGTIEQLPELGYAGLLSEHGVVLLAESKVAEYTNEGLQ